MPYICMMVHSPANLQELMRKAKKHKISKIAVALHNNDLDQEFEESSICEQITDNSYPDLVLSGENWKNRIIVMLPDYECESVDPTTRKDSEKALIADLTYAEHLVNLGNMLIRLRSGNNINLARIVRNQRKWSFLVQVPFYTPSKRDTENRFDKQDVSYADRTNDEDPWEWWNAFRWINDFQPRLKAVLELHPDEVPEMEKVKRWLSEPLEAIIVPTSLFKYDGKKKLYLEPAWYHIMMYFIRSQVNIIISDPSIRCKWKDYTKYFLQFQQNFPVAGSLGVTYAALDQLSVPLQVVQREISESLYEEFETDTIKYVLYINALYDALKDRVPEEEIKHTVSVIMVLGAGRGPLVKCALLASKWTKRKVRIYAVEKNMHAVRTLREIIASRWNGEEIHLIHEDMRTFNPTEKADILVSELLGSFGDNELSPECLQNAKNFLKPGGISIPNRSTSYINPVMAPKILARTFDYDQGPYVEAKNFLHMESTVVTLMKSAYHFNEPEPLFRFKYPDQNTVIDYKRYKVVQFKVKLDAVLTGIAGFFEANLYKNTKLSIHRLFHTPGFQSRFPIYFPFPKPMDVKRGDIIEIHFWRRSNSYKVWYEWACSKPKKTHIHNLEGKWSAIFL